ncbi:MAG: thiamine-phosphate kinase [Leifsonia sp.]|nr:thiamine-phosphate kinase [Leifsonia sp.]|tara:strand:- start:15703 stop:16686 length:984 start_codon:yes stop_codon:yes gene_type:complete
MDTLGSIGEIAVLQRLFPRLPEAESTLVGPGDDAAVLAVPDGRVVITTDTMVQGPDFRRAWSSPFQLGWKAAVTNLSDVAAMGARPTALLVALIAPADTPVTDLEELADGFREACDALAPGCGVVGGDLSVADSLTLAITAFGSLDGRPPVLRSGARPGDVVAVSGALGLAGAGIRLLFERGVDAEGEPSSGAAAALRPEFDAVLDAQLAPRSPIGDGALAADAGATAMLDVSDGLVLDARRIARASGVRIDFRAADLDTDVVALERVLHGGEDHALLATFPAGVRLPGGFRAIGSVVDGDGVTLDGEVLDKRGGWDPYADWDGASG